ncbi:hypothetical protein F5Y19DRAFT_179147 [Xylariaceae sp. FL1651]|nr:hypothetical protein F5Y19DRAFT_179147 [Xylariaceae sp. FL1651]
MSSTSDPQAIRRRHNRQPAYSTRDDVAWRPILRARYGQKSLQNEHLQEVADSLAHIENIIILISRPIYASILQGQLAADEEEKALARHLLDLATDMIEQYAEVRMGRDDYVADYLRNEALIGFWVRGLELIKQYKDLYGDPVNESGTKWLIKNLKNIEAEAEKAWRIIIDASSYNCIDSATRSVLRRKWQIIEELIEVLDRMRAEASTVPNWRSLSQRMGEAKLKTTPQTGGGYMVFWLTVLAVLINIPTFTLVYHYSSHEAGTAQDDDFWSQLQSSVMQIIALVIASKSLWQKNSLRRWTWIIPTVVSFVSAALAVPLYVVAPKEWSAFLSMVSTAVQAFIVAQLAVTGGE